MEHTEVGVPGCMSPIQYGEIGLVLEWAASDPTLLCDLEGCGPMAALGKEFAELCDVKHALPVTSGTAAIHAALLAVGVGPGDEVITTPYSWPQTLAPVIHAGATPVFADIDPGTLHLDVESVRRCLSSKTKAILVPHLFGHVADMVGLERLAKEAGVVLMADAAHALGAALHGRPVGAWGDVACFSLGRGKLVSSGEGGMVVTSDPDVYERAVALTQHPAHLWRLTAKRGTGLGLNYRMHPLVAVLARAGLWDMGYRLEHRRQVFKAFWSGMGETELIQPQHGIPGEEPAAYGIPLTFMAEHGREEFCALAQEQGIPLRCGPVGTPLHYRLGQGPGPQPPHHPTHEPGSCPVAEERCRQRELWALSALDMDGLDVEAAWEMGQKLVRMAEHLN